MYKLLKKNSDLIQLEVIAKKLASKIKPGDIFLLKGNLGAGKTTFARFFINTVFENNSLSKPLFIKSPSFPIMINYPLNKYEILHYDFYRIKNKYEIIELNIYENIKNNVTLIEWPEIIIEDNRLEKYFMINFEIVSFDKRNIEIIHTHIKDFYDEI